MLRKILAVLLIVVAGFGLLLCAGGLIGAWVVNPPLTEGITAGLTATDGYLALADGTTEVASTQVEDVRTQLDALEQRIDSMTAETRAEVTAQIADVVKNQLGPVISAMRTTLAGLRTALIALNRSLESANRIPGVQVPTLPDELQAADQRLTEISENLTALTAAVTDVSVDGSQIEALLASTTDKLAEIEVNFDQWNAQIAALRSALAGVAAATPRAIDLTSVGLSFLFILFGAGQICLILRGVKSF